MPATFTPSWPTYLGIGFSCWGGAGFGLPRQEPAWRFYSKVSIPAVGGHLVMTSSLVVFADEQPGVTALRFDDGKQAWSFKTPDLTQPVFLACSERFVVTDKWVLDAASGELVQSLEAYADGKTLSAMPIICVGSDFCRPICMSSATGEYLWIDGENGAVSRQTLPYAWVAGMESDDVVLGFSGEPPRSTLSAFDVNDNETLWQLDNVDAGAPTHRVGDTITVVGVDQFSIVSTHGDRRFAKAHADCFPEFSKNTSVRRPLIAMSQTVAVLIKDQKVICISLKDGARQWMRPLEGSTRSLCIAGDHLYLGFVGSRITALDIASGEEVWRQDAEGSLMSIQASGPWLIVTLTSGVVLGYERLAGSRSAVDPG